MGPIPKSMLHKNRDPKKNTEKFWYNGSMPFVLSEFIVDGIIRQGIQEIRNSLDTADDKINDIFAQLKESFLAPYYGEKEINNIKAAVKKPINVTHGYALDNKMDHVLVAIALMAESELDNVAALEDFDSEEDVSIVPNVIVSFNATYDAVKGTIDATAANPDLSSVTTNDIFVDGNGQQFPIVGGITNVAGDKHIVIPHGQTVNGTGCKITSSVTIARKERKSVRTTESLQLSIITPDANLTKYFYIIIKYILLSHRIEMINYGMDLVILDGSDFSRMQAELPENLFVRFLTVRSRLIEHSWFSDNSVEILGSVGGAIKVLRDKYPREDEGDMTVRTIDEADLL